VATFITRTIRVLEKAASWPGMAAAWLVVPLILFTDYDVFSRYLFTAPTIWAFELGYMAMGAHFLLGAAYTQRERGHIRIDLLYSRLSPKAQAAIDLTGYVLLVLPFLCWTDWHLLTYTLRSYASGERSGQSAWNPVIWPFRAVFFLAFACLALQIAADSLRAARRLLSTEEDGR
jgi:TRAP-type mannitol/chloroaromatic compound transport system permease small subunit